MTRRTFRFAILATLATTALAACLLDLPTPIVDDEAGLGPDTGLPDGFMPDGASMNDGGADGGGDVIIPPMDGSCDGACVFATFNNIEPRFLDNDDASIFYALGAATIEARNIGTKAATSLVMNQGDFIDDLKVRSTFVYFTSNGTRASRVPAGGGNRTNYTTVGQNLVSIDADNSNVWFTSSGSGGIIRCGINTMPCTPTPLLAFTDPQHILVDGTVVYWNTKGNNIYYCQTSNNCASGQSGMGFGVQGFAFDTCNVYWVDGANVVKESKGTMSNVNIVDSAHGATKGFAIQTDGTNVYWLTKAGTNDGALRRCKISTGCTTTNADTLANNLANPTSLTVTGTEVFFTTQGDDTIWRVPK